MYQKIKLFSLKQFLVLSGSQLYGRRKNTQEALTRLRKAYVSKNFTMFLLNVKIFEKVKEHI